MGGSEISFQLQYLDNLMTSISNTLLMFFRFCVLKPKYIKKIFPPALSRNFIRCCNGTGTTGFPQSASRGWNRSIFPATSSSLQPEEAADLKQGESAVRSVTKDVLE